MGRGLDRRHRELTLHGWTLLLILLGLTILTGCAVANFIELYFPPGHRLYPILLTKLAQVGVMLGLAVRLRPVKEPRLTAAERQILALVPAYYGGSFMVLILNFLLDKPIPVPPVQAVLSGVVFMTLGATIWGWFYVWAAFFFLLAVAIAFIPSYGFLALGLGWMLCLVVGSIHMKFTR
jgi:XapX domain-containing protein